METMTEDEYDKIFEKKEKSISDLDLYHCEIPLLDIVPYIFDKNYYDKLKDIKGKSINYCHVMMINDSRFKHIDCRVADKFQTPKVITSEDNLESKLFVFKLDKEIDTLTLYCYGIEEGDNVTSTIFIMRSGGIYCKKELGFGPNRYTHQFGQGNKEIIITKTESVDFIFNPWVSERTDVYVFHERMMIKHQMVHQEINEIFFDRLPLGYTAVLIQSKNNEKILIKVIKTNDNLPHNYTGGAFITY